MFSVFGADRRLSFNIRMSRVRCVFVLCGLCYLWNLYPHVYTLAFTQAYATCFVCPIAHILLSRKKRHHFVGTGVSNSTSTSSYFSDASKPCCTQTRSTCVTMHNSDAGMPNFSSAIFAILSSVIFICRSFRIARQRDACYAGRTVICQQTTLRALNFKLSAAQAAEP